MAAVRHLRIVVADDDAAARGAVAEALAGRGHAVETAADGREAVELVFRLRPDVLVLDLEMPRLDGLGVARRVRRAGATARIVVVSSATGPEVRTAVEEARAAFLAKPIDLGALWALIEEGGI